MRKTRDAARSKPQKKQIVSLKKLERAQRIQREGLEKVAYDPKSIERFGGIVEYIEIIFSFEMINKNIYICGKCNFTIDNFFFNEAKMAKKGELWLYFVYQR